MYKLLGTRQASRSSLYLSGDSSARRKGWAVWCISFKGLDRQVAESGALLPLRHELVPQQLININNVKRQVDFRGVHYEIAKRVELLFLILF